MNTEPVHECTQSMNVLSRFLDQIDSQHTRRAYRTDITDFLEDRFSEATLEKIKQVTRKDVRAYVKSLRSENLSVSTQRRRLAATRRFFDWLMDEGYMDRNPARACQVDLKRSANEEQETNQVSVLTKSEVEALIQATEERESSSVRDRGLLLTILYASLRRTEVAAMNVGHVRPLGRHWVIDLPAGDAWTSAYVRIPETVVEAIEQVQTRYNIEEGALWRSLSNRNRGARLTPDAIYKLVRRTGHRAGLQDVTVEALRQTGLRLALDAGATMQQVQRHARLQSTSSIERLTDTDRRTNRLSESVVDVVDLDV